ncbi:hypothetical protein Tco_1334836 [Tanacetum coccineum]
MDDPNITMEEYVRLEEEKARKCRKVFNCETAKYGKIWYDEDVHDLRSVETEFPAIVFNDNLSSNETLFCKPTVSSLNNNEIEFRISFDESDNEDYTIVLTKTHKDDDDNEIGMIKSLGGNENTQGSNKLLEESHDKINKVFIMKSFVMELNVNIVAWNYLVNEMLFNLIKNLYVPFGIPFDPKRKIGLQERIRRIRLTPIRHMALSPRDQRHQYLRYEGLQYTEGDIADLRQGWLRYTGERDPMLRLCHRLIACSIAGRSQAPEKVTVTDLFYLRRMDVGSVNVPYLLARYLRLFAFGRKQGAMISGGQFVARLAEHFGLLTKERLHWLTVIVRDLPVIDMAELEELPRRLRWHHEAVMRMRRCLRLCHHHLGLKVRGFPD